MLVLQLWLLNWLAGRSDLQHQQDHMHVETLDLLFLVTSSNFTNLHFEVELTAPVGVATS